MKDNLFIITPNDTGILAETDAASIQNAVDAASRSGLNKIVIPRRNARTGNDLWVISETILLPSDITVVFDHCHLRMADGVFANMFRNANAQTPFGNTPEGVQKNIILTGCGQSILDGGLPNGLNESTAGKDGYPSIRENLMIYLHHVENFRIEHLTILNERWWAMAFLYARHGVISDLDFVLDRHAEDTHAHWRNQDGIDLRVGCSDILIEKIHGECGDDVIALTALRPFQGEDIPGADRDIHDVMIRDVRAYSNLCSVIRILNHSGCKIYNITMRDIFDISRRHETSKIQMAIRIGDDGYFHGMEDRAKKGDTYNITIENLHTRALCAVLTAVTVKNLVMRDIYLEKDGGYLWCCGMFHGSNLFIYHPSRDAELEAVTFDPGTDYFGVSSAENVLLENLFHTADGQHAPALFGFNHAELKNIQIRNLCTDSDSPLFQFYNMEKTEIPID